MYSPLWPADRPPAPTFNVKLVVVETALLAWFAEHGRDLPWRQTRDPYAILVSEVMLQQTQVARVVPRYLACLARWPTVEALASATPADVIREWQGLGYNRRALNLHRARVRSQARAGPRDLTELPGVGRYTADAVARFALEPAVLPVDTNVRRVLERTGGEFGPASAHALMDLGATICLGADPALRRLPARGRAARRGGAATSRFGSRAASRARSASAARRTLTTRRRAAKGGSRALDEEATRPLAATGSSRFDEVWSGLPDAVRAS